MFQKHASPRPRAAVCAQHRAGEFMLARKERTMVEETLDRRALRRFDMRLPASIRTVGDPPAEFLTETQNVSARGVFFYIDRTLADDSRIEVTLTFPPHITLTDALRVRFVGRVVRVEPPLPSARVGIAAVIEEYEFLRATPAEHMARFPAQKPPDRLADS
jgi:hypothetical protein